MVGYFQGLSYICAYLFYKFKDVHETYKVMRWVVQSILKPSFATDMQGLTKLTYLQDSLLQKLDPSLNKHLQLCGAPAVNYSVSCLLTMFSTFISSRKLIVIVDRIWDLVLAHKHDFVVRIMVFMILEQKREIMAVEEEELLIALKSIDKHPFGVMKHINIAQHLIDYKLLGVTKQDILRIKVDSSYLEELENRYHNLHLPFLLLK